MLLIRVMWDSRGTVRLRGCPYQYASNGRGSFLRRKISIVFRGSLSRGDRHGETGDEMNYREAMEYMEQIGQYGMSPGLDGIRELCRRLGDPQKDLPVVHVAGTNGKGSVSAFVAAVLERGGYRVGRFLSPAVFDWREEIQVNGSYITKKAVCGHMERLKEACDGMAAEGWPHPTPFEVKTAMGFLYFRDKKCSIIVLEAGMGGLLDATNIVEDTCVAALTSISRDHMAFLGETLPEIAAQKAGIIKKGCHVVALGQAPEVMEAIAGKAADLDCPLTVANVSGAGHVRYGLERQSFDYGGYRKVEISLAGQYQIDNAVMALEVLRVLGGMGFPVKEEKLREGMLQARWPGRFTVIGKRPYFIVDGAHNEDGARRLAESLESYFPGRRIVYIMGMLRDKEYERVIGLTHKLADQIVTVAAPGNPRALSAWELAGAVARVHPSVTAADSPEEAVEMARLLAGREDVIVAFGSLSFLGHLTEAAGGGKG